MTTDPGPVYTTNPTNSTIYPRVYMAVLRNTLVNVSCARDIYGDDLCVAKDGRSVILHLAAHAHDHPPPPSGTLPGTATPEAQKPGADKIHTVRLCVCVCVCVCSWFIKQAWSHIYENFIYAVWAFPQRAGRGAMTQQQQQQQEREADARYLISDNRLDSTWRPQEVLIELQEAAPRRVVLQGLHGSTTLRLQRRCTSPP